MPETPKTAKHTLTLQTPIYEALNRSAAKRGLDVNTHMQNVLTDHVIDDDTPDAETRAQIELGRSLIERAVETAKQRCRDGLLARTKSPSRRAPPIPSGRPTTRLTWVPTSTSTATR